MNIKIEKLSINEAIVSIGNELAVRHENGTIVEDNFYAFWSTFWDGLQHDRLTFKGALDRATDMHGITTVNLNYKEFFYHRIGVSSECTTPLNSLINEAANAALVDKKSGHDRYMEGWTTFWQKLRAGFSAEAAILAAITPEQSLSSETSIRAIGAFINGYRAMAMVDQFNR